jgi:hypothetical protein
VDLLRPDPDPADPARLRIEAERVCERLRTMSLVRLAAPLGEGGTRAARGFALAQELVDLAASARGEVARSLPHLPDTAVGDVLAVAAQELVEALEPLDETRAGACRRATGALVDLRLAL